MAKRRPAHTMIRALRNEADYDAALAAIERYFDKPPKPGTPAADRFSLLAKVIEDYERKRWPIEPPKPLTPAARTTRSQRSAG
jgi:HTH-type transcriptional regulator / antitoxin HigA